MVRRAEGVRPAQDAIQTVEALEREGVFAKILAGLAAEEPEEKAAMIDTTYIKTHLGGRTALEARMGEQASDSRRDGDGRSRAARWGPPLRAHGLIPASAEADSRRGFPPSSISESLRGTWNGGSAWALRSI